MKKSLLSAVALTAVMAFSSSAWAEIVIGVAGPITGPNAAFGAQLQKGAEQAAADINAAGGINGEQIKVVIADDDFEVLARLAGKTPKHFFKPGGIVVGGNDDAGLAHDFFLSIKAFS